MTCGNPSLLLAGNGLAPPPFVALLLAAAVLPRRGSADQSVCDLSGGSWNATGATCTICVDPLNAVPACWTRTPLPLRAMTVTASTCPTTASTPFLPAVAPSTGTVERHRVRAVCQERSARLPCLSPSGGRSNYRGRVISSVPVVATKRLGMTRTVRPVRLR
mmetsp:Transcript_15964/g.34702  ORF Transcript_15964/g.34702 Transcript_15964/m.34702 type:complete len:162 (+) Transcript_15964:264-749(+)